MRRFLYIKPDTSEGTDGPDGEFMKECGKIDKNPPETWQKYDRKTDSGAYNIFIMEVNELKKAHDSNDAEGIAVNTYHVATAALNLWRAHKHDK